MVEEAAVDVSGNNLESIIQYCRTVFTKISVPDLSLYPAIMSAEFFVLKKKMEKRLGVVLENEFYLT